jgi:hypothetical protein
VSVCGVLLLGAGCNRKDTSRANFKTAIDNYSNAHPDCLWSQSKKFPVQAATSDDAKTQGYDALTDAGLLTRTTAEKKILILSKQVNNYDISSQGRSDWTTDPTEPGYGNFCYGHRTVSSIDSYTTGVNSAGEKTAQVHYHYTISDVPGWAKNAEVQTAFPKLNSVSAGAQPAQATLTMNGNEWQVSQ